MPPLATLRESDLTDRQKITSVFNVLRRSGITARSTFKCCQGCALYALTEEYGLKEGDPYVFYHQQDADAFGKDNNLNETLYLAHGGGTGALATAGALAAAGFEIDWDGSDHRRIGVKQPNPFGKE